MAEVKNIKILSAGSMNLGMTSLLPDLHESSGITVTIEYGPAGAIARKIANGEHADVAIVTRSQLEVLERQGKIAQGSRVNIAGVGIGVAVRKGAAKPDISTVAAFKRALFSARSFGYRDPSLGSSSGAYVASMLERLGVAQDLKPKIRLIRLDGEGEEGHTRDHNVEEVFQALAKGEIEIQIGQMTEIVLTPGVDLVGPLPDEIQNVTLLAAGIVTTSTVPEAAKALIRFISSSSAAAILEAKGYQMD